MKMSLPIVDWSLRALLNVDLSILRVVAMRAQVGTDAREGTRVAIGGITDLQEFVPSVNVAQLMHTDGVTVEEPLVAQGSIVGRLTGEDHIVTGLTVVFLGLNVDMDALWGRSWCTGTHIDLHISLIGCQFVLGHTAVATLIRFAWRIEDQSSAIGGGVAIGLAIDTSPDHTWCRVTAYLAVDLIRNILREGL